MSGEGVNVLRSSRYVSFGRQTDVGDGRTRRAGPSRASRRVASRLVASCASRHVSSRIVSSHRVASWRRFSSRRVASRGIASRRVASRRVRASIVIRRRTSSVPPPPPLLPHEYHSRRSQHIGTLLNSSYKHVHVNGDVHVARNGVRRLEFIYLFI